MVNSSRLPTCLVAKRSTSISGPGCPTVEPTPAAYDQGPDGGRAVRDDDILSAAGRGGRAPAGEQRRHRRRRRVARPGAVPGWQTGTHRPKHVAGRSGYPREHALAAGSRAPYTAAAAVERCGRQKTMLVTGRLADRLS